MKNKLFLAAAAGLICTLMSCGGSNLPEQKEVTVSTASQLLEAIASNTRIVVDCSDTLELEDGISLDSVSNLTIESAPGGMAHLRVGNQYDHVVEIINCSNITISGLKLGHNWPRGGCEGDVILVSESRNVKVNGCRLYGCGMEGIFIDQVKNFEADSTTIYECSYSGVNITAYEGATSNIKFNACKIENCANGVIVTQEDGTSVSGVSFSNCSISCSLTQPGSGVIRTNVPLELDNCDIASAVEITPETMANLKQSNCSITSIPGTSSIDYTEGVPPHAKAGAGKEEDEDEEEEEAAFMDFDLPDESALNVVRVASSDQFFSALKSNTKIIVESSKPIEIQNFEYGDSQVSLREISNLVIEGAGSGAKLFIRNGFNDVINAERCKNLVFRNLTLGHDVEPGSCDGNVMDFLECEGIVVENCKLYGCGVIGFCTTDCRDIKVTNCDIYQCSSSAVSISGTSNARFYNCIFRECPVAFVDYGEDPWRAILLENCQFGQLEDDLFKVENMSVTVKSCKGVPPAYEFPNVKMVDVEQ